MDSRAVAPPLRPAFLQTKRAVRLSPSWHQSSVSGRIQHLTTGHHVMTACRLWPFRGGIQSGTVILFLATRTSW